ncbi:hypothetical protein D1BOALGB6SA_9072 [Olavius sp. associated proteobacterium Delta 1]|nr:hypothetical protein D1BOALGB6SA_9072 [Olavius sp. associated proteobacterium Delta 1]
MISIQFLPSAFLTNQWHVKKLQTNLIEVDNIFHLFRVLQTLRLSDGFHPG